MKESDLNKKVAELIRKRGGWARKVWGGGLQSAGWPDVVGVYRGVPLFLEGKLPGQEKKLTVIQALTLKEAKDAGAVTRVFTSVQSIETLLDAIDRVKDRGNKSSKTS